ncbi:hypothetical protein VTJ83DRAFT_4526 [Remersonia thermophila]|uniref:Aminotransferase class I/classII large domain-containing protein n=1 Tax=Remersonia thermophila TaxID=72144 RepID=A0ABR4DA61_9PEZI
MSSVPLLKTTSAKDAASSFHIADRAGHNFVHMRQWEGFEKSLANPWTPDTPDGLVNLGVAENALMHREVVEFMAKNTAVNPISHLTYGSGPKGSPRLRQALASFLNSGFQPREPVRGEDILVLTGVTSVVDNLAWAILNEGEGIIIPQPFYSGFSVDIPTRAHGVIVPLEFQKLKEYSGFDDVFDPVMNAKALEAALEGAKDKGIKVRAVLVTNPHNPLGRCYPAETLLEIASFCGRHGLHLISDEIYAKSVFQNPKARSPVPFVSILSLDLADRIDSQLVHVLYGASKDFCANGLRLGMLYSRNQGLQAAIASTSMLAWPPYLIQEAWAAMLEDEAFTSNFLETNQKRLAEQYAFTTQRLDEFGIPHHDNTNAGMFIWIDLRRYLTGKAEVAPGELSLHGLSEEEKAKYRHRESELGRRLFENGVNIALGTWFATEELGWFRLGYTVSREALETGLERIRKTLREVEESGWA